MGTPLPDFHAIENRCLYLFKEDKEDRPKDLEGWWDQIEEYAILMEKKYLKIIK